MAKETLDPALVLLERVQNLLRDSSYTTTYKFALLRALCDLAIELPETTSKIALQTIAERFIHLYWRQVQPFTPPNQDACLNIKQGSATILNLVQGYVRDCDGRISNAAHQNRMRNYARNVAAQLKRYVVPLLQGKNEFLYSWKPGQDSIQLFPGVLATLRRFHALLCDLIDGAWTRWVERRNIQVRNSDALRKHLFGFERENIESVREPLIELQRGLCFYSGEKLSRGERANHIDHFIPWSLARHESLGNLVVCTSKVNLKWSDTLKPAKDRARWEVRNKKHALRLQEIANTNGLRWDPRATLEIAKWAYSSAG